MNFINAQNINKKSDNSTLSKTPPHNDNLIAM